MDKYLNVAIEAVTEASEICRKVQRQLISEDTLVKKDRSPVTVADFASQAIVCKILKEHFPEIPIVGEEDARSLRDQENAALLEKIAAFLPQWNQDEILTNIDHGNGAPSELFWTLDPIDGTKGFLRGDQYAVALGLIENGKVIKGVLGCPNLPFEEDSAKGTIMYAAKGQGAFAKALNSDKQREAKVSDNTAEDIVRFLESVEAGHANHGLQGEVMSAFSGRAQSVRYDSQVKYAVLAQGKAEVYLRLPNPAKPDYREKIWDHAAGVAIIQEAGGRVTDKFGKELDFSQGKKLTENRGVIVSNGKVHERIIALLNG